jgi:hypothetical protein
MDTGKRCGEAFLDYRHRDYAVAKVLNVVPTRD